MTLVDKLKSLLGLGASDSQPEAGRDVGVTVEREAGETPDASTERQVKGTDAPPEAPSSPEGKTETTSVEEPTDEGQTDTDEAAESVEADEAVAVDEATDAEPAEGGEPGAVEEAESTDEAEGDDADGESTDALEGIGPAYADRLAEAGIDTVGELAAADPEDLADRTDVSEKRLGRWVQRARDR